MNSQDEKSDVENESKAKLNTFTKLNLETNTNLMEVDIEAESDNISTLASNNEINMNALARLAIFIKIVKYYIKVMSELENDPSQPFPSFRKPNLAYVPVINQGANKDTPVAFQICLPARSDTNTDSSPLKRFDAGIQSLEEAKLYMMKLNSFYCFPRIIDSQIVSDSHVNIHFEELIPLIGDGIYGPYGNLFGSQVRTESPIQLILDACTFAVHALYGLFVLHEIVGYVHGNISPENIMFSPTDGIWKINDFKTALPIQKSLETIRHCGTKDFTAPEFLKTGISTKSSDVYSLGQILWRIFHVQMIWLMGLDDPTDQVQQAYDNFCESVSMMIKDSPNERPSIISSMKLFNEIIKCNPIQDFHIYGSDKLMIAVDKLIEGSDVDEKEKDVIPLNEITINM